MMVTRRSLPRRTVLRGVGATLALPFLDAMAPALTALRRTAAAPSPRLGFVYVPNGVVPWEWRPDETGPGFALSPTLAPLASLRDQILVLTGLAHRQANAFGDGNGDHSRASAVWLTGVHARQTEGADVLAGVSADQIAARALGRQTPLPSLELALEANVLIGNCDVGYSCVYQNTIAWRTSTTPVPMETHPRIVFERLFGDGSSPEVRQARLRSTRSILDSVTEETARLQQTLGAGDRTRMTQYLDAVREVEQRVKQAEDYSVNAGLELPERPVSVPEEFADHARLMFDLLALAYQADITRVSTFLLGRELSQRTYPEIGVPSPHHTLSHHRGDDEKIAQVAKINLYHVQLFSRFLETLQSMPDGDGSLLDHTMLLYGGGIGDGNLHEHVDLPVLLAGGGAYLRTGRHVVYEEEPPMANLLLSLLARAGVPTDALGDSTGRLAGLSEV